MMLPVCPTCGCPARVVIMTARVRCELLDDNSPGRVLSAGKKDGTEAQYECGGKHVWKQRDTDL